MLDANSDREGCMRYWTCNLYVCVCVVEREKAKREKRMRRETKKVQRRSGKGRKPVCDDACEREESLRGGLSLRVGHLIGLMPSSTRRSNRLWVSPAFAACREGGGCGMDVRNEERIRSEEEMGRGVGRRLGEEEVEMEGGVRVRGNTVATTQNPSHLTFLHITTGPSWQWSPTSTNCFTPSTAVQGRAEEEEDV